jgi:hypothetical protein
VGPRIGLDAVAKDLVPGCPAPSLISALTGSVAVIYFGEFLIHKRKGSEINVEEI